MPEAALFNLNTDPAETTDVSASHRKIVARLRMLADRYAEKFGDPVGEAGSEFRQAGLVKDALPINANFSR